MRILKIEFENLNSLEGRWKIDLTHPVFESEGIFAVVGPTGAGKTTILDAVCLALYGRTPRLNKVTKSENEIMSRRTGECFAEVTFETLNGRYIGSWRQHRARKKPDGELQPPKHEISEADSGKILESKILKTAGKVQEVTGMGYDQFTRAVLLAQGSFAVFLQASSKERSPILEQITGTEIYSKISKCVHNRRSDERKKLDDLNDTLLGMRFLTPEEEAELAQLEKEKTKRDKAITEEAARKQKAVSWLSDIARLEETLRINAEKKDNLNQKLDAFSQNRKRLMLAEQALGSSGAYAALLSMQSEQKGEQKKLDDSRRSEPSCKKAEDLAEKNLKAATEHLEQIKSEQQKELVVIREVKVLDSSLIEKNKALKDAEKAVSEREESLKRLGVEQKKDTAASDEKKQALGDLVRRLEETKADEALATQLTGICERFETLKNLRKELVGKQKERGTAENDLSKAENDLLKAENDFKKQKRDLNDIEEALKQKRSALENLLGDKELGEWREQKTLLSEKTSLLDQAVTAVEDRSAAERDVLELGKKEATLCAEKSSLKTRLKERVEKQSAHERELELLETQLVLLNKIENFEKARADLRDGEQCPLCGSTEHPFAEGNVPVPNETRRSIDALKGDLATVRGEIEKIKIERARAEKDLEQAAVDRKAHAEKIKQTSELIKQLCEKLLSDASAPDLKTRLEALARDNRQEVEEAEDTIKAAEKLEKELGRKRDLWEKAKDSDARAERRSLDAKHKKSLASERREQLDKDIDNFKERENESLCRLNDELRAFDVELLPESGLEETGALLTKRRDRWVKANDKKTKLEQEIETLKIRLGQRAEHIESEKGELEKQKERHGEVLQDRLASAEKRRELFGDKDPDKEEARLSGAVEAADKARETAGKKFDEAKNALNLLRSKIEDFKASIATRDSSLNDARRDFSNQIKAAGFLTEDDYKAACLPEEERKILAQEAQSLDREKVALDSVEKENKEALEAEREKQITEESSEVLKAALEALTSEQREIQATLGGVRQKLKDNEEQKQRQQEKLRDVEAQTRECDRWDLLHELIGSADGEKYRNFAQGLTFELVIGHANKQLGKMSDRYLLIRNTDKPLELDIIDNYQAGEIRSAKNLSGGESFLVSLSLALGLSSMAGKNVRVDSLFLDEGFGTLDDDALDTALQTLSGLRQDGKLIGVISHVPSLNDRIPARIQVEPRTGGTSTLSGPGCRAGSQV